MRISDWSSDVCSSDICSPAVKRRPLMRCEDLTDDLSAAADGSALLGRNERRHVERCLRCQAELVQYRKVLRAMRALRPDVLAPAPGLLARSAARRVGNEDVRVDLGGRRIIKKK